MFSFCGFMLSEVADFHHRGKQGCVRVCFYTTHRCESEDRSLKAPSGIRDMSLPWRDLGEGWGKEQDWKGSPQVFQLSSAPCASVAELTRGGEIWGHQTPWLVCSADGCSSGFCTQGKENMLAGRQMWKYCLGHCQVRHVFYGKRISLFRTTFHREE